MKIVVLSSSPHKKGTSSLLVDEFIKGATEVGHDVVRYDVAFLKIQPCLACDFCHMAGPCVRKDDMDTILKDLLESDMVVFATPLYYSGFSAQLKVVIDRFYSRDGALQDKHLKSALLATAYEREDKAMSALKLNYDLIVDYLKFEDQGTVLGLGCGTVDMIKETNYPQLAYEFGKSL